eukprot:15403-Heterococcus_DN1.PRE.4
MQRARVYAKCAACTLLIICCTAHLSMYSVNFVRSRHTLAPAQGFVIVVASSAAIAHYCCVERTRSAYARVQLTAKAISVCTAMQLDSVELSV